MIRFFGAINEIASYLHLMGCGEMRRCKSICTYGGCDAFVVLVGRGEVQRLGVGRQGVEMAKGDPVPPK